MKSYEDYGTVTARGDYQFFFPSEYFVNKGEQLISMYKFQFWSLVRKNDFMGWIPNELIVKATSLNPIQVQILSF